MSVFLATHEVLTLHIRLLERYGGAPGVRDLGAVEAAVFRPQCGYYADIIEEAAALLESLLINQPFVDGNKRVAFAACDVFLQTNGYHIHMESEWLYERMMLWIAAHDTRFNDIVSDLRECVSPDA